MAFTPSRSRSPATPVHIEVAPSGTTAEGIDERVYSVKPGKKADLLVRLLSDPDWDHVLVFTRTKRGADMLLTRLEREGVSVDVMHSDRQMRHRVRALDRFATGGVRVLVATDIAQRGLDVEGISHVVNYDIPLDPGDYVHRIGRTARAGAAGTAVSFLTAPDLAYLKSIELLLGRHPLSASTSPSSTTRERPSGSGTTESGAGIPDPRAASGRSPRKRSRPRSWNGFWDTARRPPTGHGPTPPTGHGLTMILKRYGTRLHSVQPDFDSRALTEIGFRRDRRLSFGADDFDEGYEAVEALELSARADGPVHDHAEQGTPAQSGTGAAPGRGRCGRGRRGHRERPGRRLPQDARPEREPGSRGSQPALLPLDG